MRPQQTVWRARVAGRYHVQRGCSRGPIEIQIQGSLAAPHLCGSPGRTMTGGLHDELAQRDANSTTGRPSERFRTTKRLKLLQLAYPGLGGSVCRPAAIRAARSQSGRRSD